VAAACLGKQSCSVPANNGVFGDPCGGTAKQLRVQVSCGAASGGGYQGTNGSGFDYRSACVAKVNAFRATLNLPALVRRKDMEECADAQAKQDFHNNKAHGALGQCQESIGQCECPNWGNRTDSEIVNQCLQQMWDEGPGSDFSKHGHFRIMSNADAKGVACGIYREGGNVWAIQNYYR
jgi:hypothetical protein